MQALCIRSSGVASNRANLEEELKVAKETAQNLQKQLQDLKDNYARLEKKFEESKKSVERLRSSRNTHRNSVNELKAANEEALKQISELEEELKEKQASVVESWKSSPAGAAYKRQIGAAVRTMIMDDTMGKLRVAFEAVCPEQ